MSNQEPTFWQAAWTWIKRVFRWIAAPLPALILVIGAVILIILGVKDIQIGGLLNKLFGKEDSDPKGKKAVDIANSIPEDRIKDGKLISPGEPDSRGQTQAVVVPIKESGLFGDSSKITITPPGGEPIEVKLPDGVKSKDVDKVIITQPGDFVVVVKDSSGVKAEDVDSLLKKYSKS